MKKVTQNDTMGVCRKKMNLFVDLAKYNLIRSALADNTEVDHDLIEVKPMFFALKTKQIEEVIELAKEILQDPDIIHGITPLHTIKKAFKDVAPTYSEIVYVMLAYAIAIQQGWIQYNTILHKYVLNKENPIAKDYVEDYHRILVK